MTDLRDQLQESRDKTNELPYAEQIAQNLVRLEQENEALRRELEQYRTAKASSFIQEELLNYIHDAILTMDRDYILTGWNSGAERLYGWSAAEAIGKPVNEVIRSDVTPEAIQAALHALHETGHYKMEVVQYTRDGRQLTVQAHGIEIKDAQGQTTGYVSANLDVSVQKRAEQEREQYLRELHAERLRTEQALAEARQTAFEAEESKRILEALMEYIPEGVTIATAPDVNIRMVSRFGQELTGRKPDEIEGIPYTEHPQHWQIYYPGSGELVPGDLLPLSRATLQGEVVENEELILRRASGRPISILCNAGPIRDQQGQITGGIIAWRDITERRKAEENLRQSRELLRAIIDNASAAIYAKDLEGRFILTNRYHAALLGRHPRDVIGKRDIDFQDAAPRSEIYANNDQQVIAHRQPITFEETAPALDGGEHTYLSIKFPLFDAEENIYGICGISTDITDRKQAELALNQYADRIEQVNLELQQVNRELNDFAFTASHDLQEPLRKVSKFGELLQDRYSSVLDQEGQAYLGRMINAVQRMQQMIKSLLEYSRITSRERAMAPVDLNQVAREVLVDLETRLEQTKGTVELGDLPVLISDALQMRQLLQNLIGNALKFHKVGVPPHVKIWSEYVPEAPSSAKPGCCHRLIIQDNGIGFNPQYAHKLFQPFIRLHSRSEYEGTGMGLAICRKIAERHRGNIQVVTQPGKGTTFIVTLYNEQPKA